MLNHEQVLSDLKQSLIVAMRSKHDSPERKQQLKELYPKLSACNELMRSIVENNGKIACEHHTLSECIKLVSYCQMVLA